MRTQNPRAQTDSTFHIGLHVYGMANSYPTPYFAQCSVAYSLPHLHRQLAVQTHPPQFSPLGLAHLVSHLPLALSRRQPIANPANRAAECGPLALAATQKPRISGAWTIALCCGRRNDLRQSARRFTQQPSDPRPDLRHSLRLSGPSTFVLNHIHPYFPPHHDPQVHNCRTALSLVERW